MSVRTYPSHHRVRELFDYDRWTGLLIWRTRQGARALAGDEAGCIDKNGRIVVFVDGHSLAAARLIWLWMTPPSSGEAAAAIPSRLKFEDGDPLNLRWRNIRPEAAFHSTSRNAVSARKRRVEKARKRELDQHFATSYDTRHEPEQDVSK